MNEVAISRTPHLIAIEINSIKEQTRKMLLFNSIEIGNRLIEAKAMIEHGQWGKWLAESVDYSQSTAINLMRIAEEYGSKQMVIFGSNANSQALGKLSYTQAVALLGIPSNEREQFIEEHDIDSMSTRELQQAIKERDQANKQNDELLEALKGAKNHISEIAEERDKLKGQLDKAKAAGSAEDVTRLQRSLNTANESLEASHQKIEELKRQLQEPVEPVVVTKVPEEVERELQELRAKASSGTQSNETLIRFKVQFDSLVKGFGDLLGTLSLIEDTEAQGKYKGAVLGLIGKMQECLNA